MLRQAIENIDFFRRGINLAKGSNESGMVEVYEKSLREWVEYRDYFAVLAYEKLNEYQNAIRNNSNGRCSGRVEQ